MELRNAQGQTLAEFLAAYDVTQYNRPSVTADTALFTMEEWDGALRLALVLIRRGNHPDIGRLALPGGFLNVEETALEGAARELMEETGVTGVLLRPFGVFDAPYRDLRTRVITIAHFGLAPLGTIHPAGGDDAVDAGLFGVSVQRESWSASAETYRIDLSGSEEVCCRAQLRFDPLGNYTASLENVPHGLASDHDHVVFGALRALNAIPRKRAARLLTLGQPLWEKEAELALERALSALSTEV